MSAIRADRGPERSSSQRPSSATDAAAGFVEQVNDARFQPDRDPEPQPRFRGGDPERVPGTYRRDPARAAIQVREAQTVVAHDPDLEMVPAWHQESDPTGG